MRQPKLILRCAEGEGKGAGLKAERVSVNGYRD
jgi:hypothetical protein